MADELGCASLFCEGKTVAGDIFVAVYRASWISSGVTGLKLYSKLSLIAPKVRGTFTIRKDTHVVALSMVASPMRSNEAIFSFRAVNSPVFGHRAKPVLVAWTLVKSGPLGPSFDFRYVWIAYAERFPRLSPFGMWTNNLKSRRWCCLLVALGCVEFFSKVWLALTDLVCSGSAYAARCATPA